MPNQSELLKESELFRCSSWWCTVWMWSRTVSFSKVGSSHRYQGCPPLPWWLIALLTICNPTTSFHPKSRDLRYYWSFLLTSLQHPPPVHIHDSFQHLSQTARVPGGNSLSEELFSSSLHSLTRQIESTSLHRASTTHPGWQSQLDLVH